MLPDECSPLLEQLPASRPPPASSISFPQVQKKELVWGWGRRELSLDPPERHSFSLAHQETLEYSFCEGVSAPVIKCQHWLIASSKLFTMGWPWSPLRNHQATVLGPVAPCRAYPPPTDSGPARVPLQGRQSVLLFPLTDGRNERRCNGKTRPGPSC